MLAGTLQTVVTYVVNLGLLALFISVLVGAVFIIFKIPARTVRWAFEAHFTTIRRRHFFLRGMMLSKGKLKRELRRESNELFATFARTPAEDKSSLPFWFATDPWPFNVPAESANVLSDAFPDLRAPALRDVADELRRLKVPAERRLTLLTHVATFIVALIFAHGWQIDTLEALRGLGSSVSTIGIPDAWRNLSSYYLDGPIAWSGAIGIWISAIVLTLFAGWLMPRVNRHVFGISTEPLKPKAEKPSDEKDVEEDVAQLGQERCAVRALSFAGGAFDTVMQIGVAHALLTIQGRAPDVVVGISGGAVNAVAVAEIIQAGEEHERVAIRRSLGLDDAIEITPQNIGDYWRRLGEDDKRRIHHARRAARVGRLRGCIEAAQQAPTRLFDSLLPDPYQIDTTDPLHPLEQPRFAPEERDEREAAVAGQTGLVRLYNDLLNIPFSIGILVRAIRRYLGIKASGEIANKRTKWAVRIVEGVRLWVLLGINLINAAPLAYTLLGAFRSPRRVSVASAGTLIFRFRLISKLISLARNTLAFILLLATWVSVTLLPFSIGHILAVRVPLVENYRWEFTALIYVALMVPSFITGGRLTQAERSTVTDLIKSAARTIIILALLAAAWTFVLFGVPLLPDMIVNGWYWPWPIIDWENYYWYVIAILLLPIGTIGVLIWDAKTHQHNFGDRLLRSYHLNDAILREHGLRTFLAELFDSNFYQKPEMDEVVEESLKDQIRHGGVEQTEPRKRLGRYRATERLEPVHVGVVVANMSSGQLDVIKGSKRVVEALVAAVSATPLFRAVEFDRELYINGSNVANEPTRALLLYLRRRINRNPGPVHIYSVSPFPLSRSELGPRQDRHRNKDVDADEQNDTWPDAPRPLLNLVDVVVRALRLQRLRDATLERRLTELISRTMRPGDNQLCLEADIDGRPTKFRYLRAWITPIELDSELNTNARLIGASKKDRRIQVLRTIADGCRASMQVMLGDAIKNTARPPVPGREGDEGIEVVIEKDETEWIAPCASVVRTHLQERCPDESWAHLPLPGSRNTVGPGLSEVCRHCRIWRDEVPVAKPVPPEGSRAAGATAEVNGRVSEERPVPNLTEHNAMHLRQKDWWKSRGPAWPHEREYRPDEVDGDPHFERKEPPQKEETEIALRSIKDERPTSRTPSSRDVTQQLDSMWPLPRAALDVPEAEIKERWRVGSDRTTVSFLFSGGVFRGVYQMGVLTALDQLGLKPDVIAGASVGSITAAMIAETFTIEETQKRHARIAQLAAVYLAIDRIILTDRFADFVRDLTLRAADTQFSIRQADRFFRKYDHPNLLEFDRNARAVVAGLERLLYINPFQLQDFVKNVRNQDYAEVLSQLRDFGQQALDRMFVGEEVLGTEALQELIEAYVTGERTGMNPVGLQFDDLRRQSGIQFLATATNLARGSLEILGERPGMSPVGKYCSPVLNEGLLASSAFPGVFRPRWSWELYPDTDVAEQYIDGGVMDNLPLDAVAQFLYRAYKADLIAKQPPLGPHLIVAASLQVNAREYTISTTRKALKESWLSRSRRAKELQYNTKLDTYRQTQEALRRIEEHYRHNPPADATAAMEDGDDLEILDLEVVAVKPNQLCSTFAFHPMLGFKRDSQKRSIAHGCASTLLKFGEIRNDERKTHYLEAWRVCRDSVPLSADWLEAFDKIRNKRRLKEDGLCWLTAKPCPFASQSLNALQDDSGKKRLLAETTIEEVAKIHHACMEPGTHLRQI